MLTNSFLVKENNRLRQELNDAKEQLRAACEALGNTKIIDSNVYQLATKNTGLSRNSISGILKL